MTDSHPLVGTVVLLTRRESDDRPLQWELERLGASVLSLPINRIEPPKSWSDLDRALDRLADYHWIAFTSRNAVRSVIDRMALLVPRGTLPSGMQVASVGDATAKELQARGIEANCRPEKENAAFLADAMIARGVRNTHVLVPVGDLARTELKERLQNAGALVDAVVVYRTVPSTLDPMVLDKVRRSEIDVITLASPSAARNLAAALGRDVSPLRRLQVVCIGPTTARAVRHLGLKPAAVAARPTSEALVQAILNLRATESQND